MSEPATVVIFRKWRSGEKSVFALFPELPATANDAGHCLSYEHIGQHGAANYWGAIEASKPANPHDYADLRKELTRIGYNLHPVSKATQLHHSNRRKAAGIK